MGRMYAIPFAAAASGSAIDFFEITAADDKPVRLHEVRIGQSTEAGDAQDEMIGIFIKRFSGGFTSGSGGTASATVSPLDSDDATVAVASETCNTTQCSGGTSVTLVSDAFNVRAGWQYLPTPECRIRFKQGEALVIGMAGAPADSITWYGTAIVEEV